MDSLEDQLEDRINKLRKLAGINNETDCVFALPTTYKHTTYKPTTYKLVITFELSSQTSRAQKESVSISLSSPVPGLNILVKLLSI